MLGNTAFMKGLPPGMLGWVQARHDSPWSSETIMTMSRIGCAGRGRELGGEHEPARPGLKHDVAGRRVPDSLRSYVDL